MVCTYVMYIGIHVTCFHHIIFPISSTFTIPFSTKKKNKKARAKSTALLDSIQGEKRTQQSQ